MDPILNYFEVNLLNNKNSNFLKNELFSKNQLVLIRLFEQLASISNVDFSDYSSKLRFCSIEGSSGVGKSAVCDELELMGLTIVRDDLKGNPFLENTKSNQNNNIFENQLYFRLNKLLKLYKLLFSKDFYYIDSWFITEDAHIKYFLDLSLLDSRENTILENLYTQFIKPLIPYTKFFILDANTNCVKERIIRRGRIYESEDKVINMQLAIKRNIPLSTRGLTVVTIETDNLTPIQVAKRIIKSCDQRPQNSSFNIKSI